MLLGPPVVRDGRGLLGGRSLALVLLLGGLVLTSVVLNEATPRSFTRGRRVNYVVFP